MKPKIGIVQIPCDLEFQKIMKTLTLAAKDNQLHGLILIIDNDGGDIGQFSALHDLIKKITTIKPVIGLVCGNACSCGYWIASATSYLYCSSASDIGSIGSFLEIEKYSDQRLASNEKNTIEAKIDYEIFTAANYKTIHNSNIPLSEAQRAYLKNKVTNTYHHLINSVAINRNLSVDNHLDWADAKTFLGHEALKLGLVDALGTQLDAEQKVLELIKQKCPNILFDNTIETVELT